jgi:hypothetical protein
VPVAIGALLGPCLDDENPGLLGVRVSDLHPGPDDGGADGVEPHLGLATVVVTPTDPRRRDRVIFFVTGRYRPVVGHDDRLRFFPLIILENVTKKRRFRWGRRASDL